MFYYAVHGDTHLKLNEKSTIQSVRQVQNFSL